MYVALKIDKIEFYLCVEKQVGCTCMEGEKGSGTDISKHPIIMARMQYYWNDSIGGASVDICDYGLSFP